jgi:hypothetical protein
MAVVGAKAREWLSGILAAAAGELPQPIGMQPPIGDGQLERTEIRQPFKHLAQALGRSDLRSFAEPTQAGARAQLRVDLEHAIQAQALLSTERLQQQALDAALGQVLHRPDEALQGGHAWRDDLLGPQAFNGCLDQWQRAITLERQRQELTPEHAQLWPAAVLEPELAPQLVEVLEDGVVAFAILFEDGWVDANLLRDVLDHPRWDVGHIGERAAGEPEEAELDGEAEAIGCSTVALNDAQVAARVR